MDGFSPAYLLPFFGVFVFSIIGIIAMSWFFFFPLLYWLCRSPNRFLSSLFSFFIWGGGLFCILLGFGLFLNDLLTQLGFRTETIPQWPLHDLRIQIVIFLIGIYFVIIGRKFLPNSIFDTEKNETKSPTLYASHGVHFLGTGVLIGTEIILLAYLSDWLLQFIVAEQYEIHEAGLSFAVNFISAVLPTLFLGLFLLPSFQEKKRFFPKIKSETYSVFFLIVFFGTSLMSLSIFGILLRESLIGIFDNPEALGYPIHLDEARPLFIILILSFITAYGAWRKCGGKDAYVKK
jgi:hypothetical protein